MYKNYLYYIRIARGKTQKEFADELGMHPNVYSKYERGVTNMSLEVAKGIAQYCNVSLDYLAGLVEPDYSSIGEGQAELEAKENERQIEEKEKELEISLCYVDDEIDKKLAPVIERLEAIEKKLGNAQTDSQSEE